MQFDRPIAGFQAVRHRLADSLVAIEAADAAAHAAGDDGSPLTAALAKAVAGRSARTVARHAQQVLAGIGFTTEHPLHLYVRRALVLDHLLGDARSLTARPRRRPAPATAASRRCSRSSSARRRPRARCRPGSRKMALRTPFS